MDVGSPMLYILRMFCRMFHHVIIKTNISCMCYTEILIFIWKIFFFFKIIMSNIKKK